MQPFHPVVRQLDCHGDRVQHPAQHHFTDGPSGIALQQLFNRCWFLSVGPIIRSEATENTVQAVQQRSLDSSSASRIALHHSKKIFYIDVPLSYRAVVVDVFPPSRMFSSGDYWLAGCHRASCLCRCLQTTRLLWCTLVDAVVGEIRDYFCHLREYWRGFLPTHW
jgi:hypothetical protein